MSRESRSIFLVVLTLVIYAVSISLKEGGTFIFPFPLNPFFFAAVALYFSFIHRSKRTVAIVVTLTALFGVLASNITWEVLLSVENLRTFFNYPMIYWFHLLFGVGIVLWAAYTLYKQKDLLAKILVAVGTVFFGIGYAIGEDLYVLTGFAFLMTTTLAKPTFYPFNLLWLLLFLLESTKWINYLFA